MEGGVENLMLLAKKHQVSFTFFVSMGKAFRRRISIKKKLVQNSDRAAKFSMTEKLSRSNLLDTFLKNPTIGASHPELLKEMVAEGHELGLHGGKNHATWEQNAHTCSIETLEDELCFGFHLFSEFNLPHPVSFASPCWNSPIQLPAILYKKHFKILADRIDTKTELPSIKKKVKNYPTNITGRDGTVGYLENLRALGHTTPEILTDFKKQLQTKHSFAMVFDHPFYAGIHEIEVVDAMLTIAKDAGFTVQRLDKINEKLVCE